ncbi:MAG: phosphoribosylamine--glycine ligase [Acidobacteriota bacterium]
MRVLLVGSGGREHALARSLARSPHVGDLLWAPGNGGASGAIRTAAVRSEDVEGLARLAQEARADLVVVGPEVPLALGLADRLQALSIPCFGPVAGAARLEASKVFTKEFCRRWSIPTAGGRVFDRAEEARRYLASYDGPFPLVLKADGLAAGKGVLLCGDRAEALEAAEAILVRKDFGDAGNRLLVEEFLEGEEASLLVFADGRDYAVMPPARDYKRAEDGDRGPNTGGMGAYCPASVLSEGHLREALHTIVEPALEGIAAEGCPYRGVLYAGLMVTASGPKLLEFNCRFGDPETQVVLPRLESDLVEVALACAEGRLGGLEIRWRAEAAVTVVLASRGYPGPYRTGVPIEGIEEAEALPGVQVYHAGTRRDGDRLVTAGGRVLNVTALAPTVGEARERAYDAAARIRFEGKTFRTDIAGGP